MIELDWTLVAAGVVFLVTLVALNSLLFKPLFRTLEERREKTSGLKSEAHEKLSYHESLFEEYSSRIKAEKQQGYQLAESVRKEALDRRQEMITEAKTRAQKELSAARDRLAVEVKAAEEKLRHDVEEIAQMITSRILRET